MSQTIPVEAHFDSEGVLQPKRFLWRNEPITVDAVGRRWVEGEYRHFLVGVEGLGTFELAYHLGEHAWDLRREPADFGPRKPAV